MDSLNIDKQTFNTLDVLYDDKKWGKRIDPDEWNANFKVLEEGHNELATKLNQQVSDIDTAIQAATSNGGQNISVQYGVGTETLQDAFDNVVSDINNRYTKNEVDASIGSNTNSLIANAEYNESTGVFTFTRKDGSSVVIDTVIEKVPASMALVNESDGSVSLVITNQDGSQTKTNVTSLIEDTVINSSDTINATSVTDAVKKVTTYTLVIKPNSIGLAHIDSALTAKFEETQSAKTVAIQAKDNAVAARDAAISAKNSAETYASNANTYSTNASVSADESADSALEAKGYAEQAASYKNSAELAKVASEKAKDNSETYASSANTYSSNASKSATESANSALKAKEYSEQAFSSKTSAESAQSAAEEARDVATQKASDANQSAQSAENSMTIAVEKANSASTFADNAETSANNAASSLSAVESAKTAAETAKNDAQTAATEASKSEAAAKQSATSASHSASSASQSATNASNSAASALQSKEAAALSEANSLANKNASAKSASAAATSETNAASSALAAKTAQTAAEKARDEAQAIAGGDYVTKVELNTHTNNTTLHFTADEKTKLAGIEENANNYIHPSSHSATMITQDSTHRFVTDTEKTTWNNKASTSVVTTTSNGLMIASDKSKLDGIATGANNYVHPTSHPASIIVEDSTHRFVTDTEKTAWSSKSDFSGEYKDLTNKPTVSTATLLASDWYSTCLYSFEIDYPSSNYDIEVALDSTATVEQAEAFNGAQIVGSATSNIVKAYGVVPTVDIPIIIKVVTK